MMQDVPAMLTQALGWQVQPMYTKVIGQGKKAKRLVAVCANDEPQSRYVDFGDCTAVIRKAGEKEKTEEVQAPKPATYADILTSRPSSGEKPPAVSVAAHVSAAEPYREVRDLEVEEEARRIPTLSFEEKVKADMLPAMQNMMAEMMKNMMPQIMAAVIAANTPQALQLMIVEAREEAKAARQPLLLNRRKPLAWSRTIMMSMTRLASNSESTRESHET